MTNFGDVKNSATSPPTKKARVHFENSNSEMMDVSNSNQKYGHQAKLQLYSRQIYALGHSAMNYIRTSKVLISGMGSVGVEVAKNLILAGVHDVVIHDTKPVEWNDLSAQFYLEERNIGKNRAEASYASLSALNSTVNCSVKTEALTEDFVKGFDLVVVTDMSFEQQIQINRWTRAHGGYFVSSDARGLFSYVFVDLGLKFTVNDVDGEPCKEVTLEKIDFDTGDVYTVENLYQEGLKDGDFVMFMEVSCLPNEMEPVKITIKDNNTFNVGDVLLKYLSKEQIDSDVQTGRCRTIKMPVEMAEFKSLPDALTEPAFFDWDFSKAEKTPQFHLLWQALYSFEKKHNRPPRARDVDDADLLNAEMPTKDGISISADLMRNFSFQARGNLQPVASFTGGIAAQEALKAITHHTTPIVQFLYTDSLEALPGPYSPYNAEKLEIEDCKPRGCRYDGQAAVFGWNFQKALTEQRWFIVGAGAIGCELLKNMAMMGVGCGKGGELRVTDMDHIELSNLNRQFLFRDDDIGRKKSEIAARAAKKFNSSLNITAYTDRVADDTEHVFDDNFFNGLSGVANALDNVDARRYMDRRCVFYQLPLLESGTMGSKGNIQVVYPRLTESYSSSSDPPEKETPTCTLRNFPYLITHTIQWAREKFGECFTTTSEITNDYLTDTRSFLDRLRSMNISQRIEILRTINRMLIDEKPKSFEECVHWARNLFDAWFRNEISQLLFNFPPEQITSTGLRFWSGTKRCPRSSEFDVEKPNHLDFICAAALLRAQQYGIPLPHPDNLDEMNGSTSLRSHVAELAAAYQSKPFKPRTGVRIAITEAENADVNSDANLDSDETDRILNELNIRLAKLQVNKLEKLSQIDFEKDDDSNHHVEFVCAASNLRAHNYKIDPADRMKTKQIAGKIIPALATTTAVVAGLVSIEQYKMIGGENGKCLSTIPIDRFKNGFLNLALPFIVFSEPIAAPVKKYLNKSFTLWDHLQVRGPMKFGELVEWIEEEAGAKLQMLSCGTSLLFAFFQPQKFMERRNMSVEDVVVSVTRTINPAHRRILVLEAICSASDTDDDVEIPYIKFLLPTSKA